MPAGMFYNVARVIKYARRFFLCRYEEDEQKAKRVAEVFLWYEKLKCLKIDLKSGWTLSINKIWWN